LAYAHARLGLGFKGKKGKRKKAANGELIGQRGQNALFLSTFNYFSIYFKKNLIIY
jgi:hypothetical protein